MAQEEYVYIDEQGKEIAPPSSGYIPTNSGRSDKADLLNLIKPDAIVETIRHKLMGEELINGRWVKIEALQGRAITQTGAWDISNLMLGASSQNVSLSKLKDTEIRERTLSIIKTAQHMLLKNWKEYGIQGTDQLEYVHQIIMTNTFITLKQPENGGIRDLIKGTTQEHRQVTNNENERRGFFFNRGK